jgi:Ca2+-binding EF-hand superfamily protein
MKVPFFSKRKKTAQADVHLASVSSDDSNVSGSLSSGSMTASATPSPSVSAREKKHKKSSSFSGPLEKLRKSSSFSGLSMPVRQNSGKLFSFKSMRQRSGPLQPQAAEHCKELTETFKYFDKNGDGKISAVELGQVLRTLGIASTHEELEAMVREVDCDNDGFIDLGEFIMLNKLTQEATGDDDSEHKTMEAAFEVFDINKDGFISATELHRVLSDLGEVLTEEDCHVMIRNVDRNGDMLVDFSEFKYLMQDTRVF